MPYFLFVRWGKLNFQVKFCIGNLMVAVWVSRWWMLESTTKFSCDVKMRSIQDQEISEICIGSSMIWMNPYCEVTNSIYAASVVVLSLIYQFLDFILKTFSATIKCELDLARVSIVSSKPSVNFSKPSLVWPAGR